MHQSGLELSLDYCILCSSRKRATWTTAKLSSSWSRFLGEHCVYTRRTHACLWGHLSALTRFVLSCLCHDRYYKGFADLFLRELQDRNIILAGTCEYRFPSPSAIKAAADASSKDKTQVTKADTVKVDMTSRLIGLVVVPGRYITRIEVEESPEEIRLREQRKGIVT